jgi:UDP-N-acetyl-2-amino-2-deoxyglucuronate dehydrogenase
MTSRGRWYQVSWKGLKERSGGLATNIGIHFFDMLIWLFGAEVRSCVHTRDEWRTADNLELERADLAWFMSADPADLPFEATAGKKTTFRSITVDGQEVEFSEGFTELHTRSYEEILAGRGSGIDDARPSIELAHRVRDVPLTPR